MNSFHLTLLSLILPFCLVLGVAQNADAAESTPEIKTLPTGLRFTEPTVGTGAEAVNGKRVSVHYTGWLAEKDDKKGKEFDSSRNRGKPFQFALGIGQVIQGWDQGVAGMKVGGKRTLFIPSHLGYGVRGAPGAIPPNADLIFDVELLGVE